jgi:hypothetical protein
MIFIYNPNQKLDDIIYNDIKKIEIEKCKIEQKLRLSENKRKKKEKKEKKEKKCSINSKE